MQNKLVFLKGDSLEIIPKLCNTLDVKSVFWNRCYERDRIRKDTKLKKYLLSKLLFEYMYTLAPEKIYEQKKLKEFA